ncbi:MAG: acyl-CoA thioesterase [Spirochaetota bacterium]
MGAITEIKVRGYHLDVFGHVNNARYLEFLEEARWTYLEQMGISFDSFARKGISLAVVNININYRAPSVLGDVLEIETTLNKIGNRSIVLNQVVHKKHDNKRVIDAEVTFVIIDLATGRAIQIDDELKQQWHELSAQYFG